MEAIPANFKAYVDQAIKNATAPLYDKIDAQAKTIAAQAKTIRKLEQRLNAYDARLKTRQLVTDNKGPAARSGSATKSDGRSAKKQKTRR